MNISGNNLYQVFIKKLTDQGTEPKDIAWVNAVDEHDAIRIVLENLDSRKYESSGAILNPDVWRISETDMTVGFRNPHAN